MSKFTSILFLVLIFLTKTFLNAQDNSSGEAYSLLKESMDKRKKAISSHIVYTEIKNKIKFDVEQFRLVAADGFIFENGKLVTSASGNIKKSIVSSFTKNRDGYWTLENKTAYLLKFASDSDANIYSQTNIFLDDLPYVKVQMKLNRSVYEQKIKNMEAIIEKNIIRNAAVRKELGKLGAKPSTPNAEDAVPFVYEYVINKDTKDILSESLYTESGDKIGDKKISKAELNFPLAEDIFEVDASYKKVIVNSLQDYLTLKKEFNLGK
jgi:hypothetical protein